jgi:hypothetical protein
MKYMIMMFGDAATAWPDKPPEWFESMNAFMMRTDRALRESGEHVDGQALAGAATATTIAFEGGAAVPTDGPFAESKESLAGYWIVDVESERRAVEIASDVVTFIERPLEVRRIMDTSGDM